MGYQSGCLGSVLLNDPLTAAWAEGVANAGGSVSPARRSTVDTLIKGLRADGVLSKLDRLWLFAAENTQSALLDVISRTTATPVASPTFAANAGYTGVDSSSTVYIDSNSNPKALIQLQLASCHISVWCNTVPVSGVNGGGCIGLKTGVNPQSWSGIYPNYNTGLTFFRINSDSALAGHPNVGLIGHYLANREAPGNATGYFNGSLWDISFASTAGTQWPDGNFYILSTNSVDGGSANAGADAQVSAASIGATLTTTDITNFYNRLRAYMTMVGLS